VGHLREALAVQADGHHEIQPQEREVGEIIPRQGFVAKVRVNEAKAAEARFAGTQALEVGEEYGLGVPHDHVLDLPFRLTRTPSWRPIRERSRRDSAPAPGQGPEGDSGGRRADPLDLAGLETLGVAVESVRGNLRTAWSAGREFHRSCRRQVQDSQPPRGKQRQTRPISPPGTRVVLAPGGMI
jgi:hypothetical protein